MSKEFAKKFYHSARWQKVRKLAMIRCDKLCEVIGCQEPALIGHHEIELTPENINDPNIALNIDNIRCVCFEHHNKIHEIGISKSVQDGLMFCSDGSIIKREIIEYKEREK